MNTAVPVVGVVIEQHVEDAALLHAQRTYLTNAPHARLENLQRFDERLAAHLDGLSIAGDRAWPWLDAALESPHPGAVFAIAVRALEERRLDKLDRLFALVGAVPEAAEGLRSAFGWIEPTLLRGVVADLLRSEEPSKRLVGIAASAMHRVDPSLGPARRLEDPDPAVRARAFRAAGELGKREFLSSLGQAIHDPDPSCQLWAAWSAVLLGDRHGALDFIQSAASTDGPFRTRAFRLVSSALPTTRAHEFLRSFSSDPAQLRWLIEGAGLVGDPMYVPWLIQHMANDALARVAGEAFSLITGADLAALDLERKPPEAVEAGPNDAPNDPNVDMDEDDGLPWPDPELVQHWWAENAAQFQAGQRFFIGAPASREHCIEVLRSGYQRQRILAAQHLSLLEPGRVLFECRAPSWRQRRSLTAIT